MALGVGLLNVGPLNNLGENPPREPGRVERAVSGLLRAVDCVFYYPALELVRELGREAAPTTIQEAHDQMERLGLSFEPGYSNAVYRRMVFDRLMAGFRTPLDLLENPHALALMQPGPYASGQIFSLDNLLRPRFHWVCSLVIEIMNYPGGFQGLDRAIERFGEEPMQPILNHLSEATLLAVPGQMALDDQRDHDRELRFQHLTRVLNSVTRQRINSMTGERVERPRRASNVLKASSLVACAAIIAAYGAFARG